MAPAPRFWPQAKTPARRKRAVGGSAKYAMIDQEKNDFLQAGLNLLNNINQSKRMGTRGGGKTEPHVRKTIAKTIAF